MLKRAITNPKMIFVQGGSFLMGSNDGYDSEKPAHKVKLKSFFISKFLVTQKLWVKIMKNNPSMNKNCDDCPVENVSWHDVKTFIERLNRATGRSYRLPTEAEWEYAASGGKMSNGYRYSGSNNIEEVAWYRFNSDNKSHPVGLKKPNELGIYDMSGNVWEWCQDHWHENYKGAPEKGNAWLFDNNLYRIIRGGSWIDNAEYCRPVNRNRATGVYNNVVIGIRLCMDA